MRVAPLSVFVAICLCILSAGCCDRKAVKFDMSQYAVIKKVGLLTIEPPEWGYTCIDEAYISRRPEAYAGSGVIGTMLGPAMVDAFGVPTVESRLEALNDAFEYVNFNIAKEVHTRLKAELTKAGYEVEDIPVERDSTVAFQDSYEDLDADVDAYLDAFVFRIGCWQNLELFDGKYRPNVSIHAQLVDANTSEVIYRAYPTFGRLWGVCGCSEVAKDKRYEWESFEDMLAETPKFIEGVRVGIDLTTCKFAQDLGPGDLLSGVADESASSSNIVDSGG